MVHLVHDDLNLLPSVNAAAGTDASVAFQFLAGQTAAS